MGHEESDDWFSSIIIVGAGIFGLSTALAISRRHPSCKITIVDRLTPPVEDGTSVDTTRCIRSDYADPIYARLAADAQKKIEEDSDLSRYYFKQGMSFVCDGQPGRFYNIWQKGLENAKDSLHGGVSIIEMNTPKAVFQRIHGTSSEPISREKLAGESKWNVGYCNLDDAFIDARECVRIYYERCLERSNITFQCGTAVSRVMTHKNRAIGVCLLDGHVLKAHKVLVAAGAWSNQLIYLEGLAYSSAIEVAWLKITNEEAGRWKNMSITTNLSTGFNIFPPYRGEIKCLRRSPGYCNTISIQHPEDSSKRIHVSVPRTTVTNPTDTIPAEGEHALRDNLQELFPTLANRPFDRTKLCWISQTPTADFIITAHPRIQNLHVATGGSAHAWKFLPTIGDMVLDSIEGRLDPELAQKWGWGRRGSDGGNAPRMDGKAKELRDVVRSTAQQGDKVAPARL